MRKLDFDSMQRQKISQWVFLVLFVVIHIFILRNILLVGRDLLYGDGSADQLIPSPVYDLFRIPDTPLSERYGVENRLSADFAPLYFPSQDMETLNSFYKNASLEFWNRPSNFAPLIHYICAISICRLGFGAASVSALIFQYLLFMAVYITSFKLLKIDKVLLAGILLANVYIFLTPSGLSWLERGQYYLYVGSAYLLILTGFIKKNKLLILLSAPLTFIRWTSVPFVLLGFAIYLFNSKNLSEARQKIFIGAGFGLIFIAMTFALPSLGLLFLKQLYFSEGLKPIGISLATILPLAITKFLPFVLIILGVLMAKINNREFEENLPFLAGAAIILLTYPTQPFQYSLVSMLGFIPFLLYWAGQPGTYIRGISRQIIPNIFLLFLLIASFPYIFTGEVVYEYILAFLILLGLPLYCYWKFRQNPGWPEKNSFS